MKKKSLLLMLISISFLCQLTYIKAQDQPKMESNLVAGLQKFLGQDQVNITNFTLGSTDEGQNKLTGNGSILGIANASYSAEFIMNSDSKMEKVELSFPKGANNEFPMAYFNPIFKAGLDQLLPNELRPRLGIAKLVLEFNNSNANIVKTAKLDLFTPVPWDILSVGGMKLEDVLLKFIIKSLDSGVPSPSVGLAAKIDVNGIDVMVSAETSKDIKNAKIVANIQKVNLESIVKTLTGGQGFSGLPLPASIMNADLGSAKITVVPNPSNPKLTVTAGLKMAGKVMGEVDIIVGKAVSHPPAQDDTDNANSQEVANADSTLQNLSPASASNLAGMAATESAVANANSSSGSGSPIEFMIGVGLNIGVFKFVDLHPNLASLDTYVKDHMPLNNAGFIISTFGGQVGNSDEVPNSSTNLNVLKNLGQTSVKRGLTVLAGYKTPTHFKKFIGVDNLTLKGQLDPFNGDIYFEGSVNTNIGFFMAKNLDAKTPIAIDPGALNLQSNPTLWKAAEFKKVAIGFAPTNSLEFSISGRVDVYLNGPGASPVQFYASGYYSAPSTLGIGLAMLKKWQPFNALGNLPKMEFFKLLKGFGIEDVTYQIGVDLSTLPTPIPEVFVGGTLEYNNARGWVAIGVDPLTLSNCLVEGGHRTLNLWELLNTFTPNQYRDELNSKTPGLAKQILDTGLKNTRIKLIPKTFTTKAGKVYERGFAMGGELNIMGWRAAINMEANPENGVSAYGWMDKVNIGSGAFKFERAGNATGLCQQSTGPCVNLNLTKTNLLASNHQPYLGITGKVSLLGLSANALMETTDNKFVMKTGGKVFNKFAANLDISGPGLKKLQDIHVKAAMKQSVISDIEKAVNDEIKILGNVEAVADLSAIEFAGYLNVIKGGSVSLSVKGKFAGRTINLPAFTVNLKTSDIGKLAKIIVDKLKGPFSDVFNQVANVVINVGTDVGDFTIHSAEDFGDTFVSAANDISDFFQNMGETIKCWFGDCDNNEPARYVPQPGEVPIAYLANKSNGKTLTNNGVSTKGRAIKLTANPGERDFWTLLPYKDKKHYLIKSMEFNLYLANMGNNSNNAPIKQTDKPGNGALWRMVKVNGGFFRLQNKASGHWLAVSGNSVIQNKTANDASVWKGGKADYLRPSSILAGKGKIIAVLYHHENYTGANSYLRDVSYDAAKFASVFPGNKMTSVKIKSGHKVIFRSGDNKPFRVVKNMSDLRLFGFSDKAVKASTSKLNPNKDAIVAELYEGINYTGNRRYLYKESSYVGENDWHFGVGRKRLSSFKISSSYKITLNTEGGSATGVEFIRYNPDIGPLKGKVIKVNVDKFDPNNIDLEGRYIFLKSKTSNHFVSVKNNQSAYSNQPIIQGGFGLNTQWQMIRNSQGYYRIKSVRTGAYIGNQGNTEHGSTLVSIPQNPGDGALWKLEHKSNGWYRFKNKKSGKYLANLGETRINAELKQSQNPGEGALWTWYD